MNGKQDCTCNAGPLQPLSSNQRLTPEKLAEYRGVLSLGRSFECGVSGNALKALLDEIEACWAERKVPPLIISNRAQGTDCPYCEDDVPHTHPRTSDVGRNVWESMRAAIAREIDATKDPATKHRLIALHANSTLPAVKPAERPRGGYVCSKCGVRYSGPNGFHECSAR